MIEIILIILIFIVVILAGTLPAAILYPKEFNEFLTKEEEI